MSKVWVGMIVFSIAFALVMADSENLITYFMDFSKVAVSNVIELVGVLCFWSGIFKIFENTSLVENLSKFFDRFIFKIFEESRLSEKAKKYISLNIVSNILGVGNAATINGINAMKEMQKNNLNADSPNDNMTTFVLINTASLQLIPTSIIGLRATYGSTSPSSIIVCVIIVTACSLISGMISIKILNKKLR